MPYTPPEFQKSSFNCPLCGAFAQMTWSRQRYSMFGSQHLTPMWVSHCSHCERLAYWQEWQEAPHPEGTDPETGHMLVPSGAQAPLPHTDMPKAVRADYEEARDIAGASPRAAAALLRLAIQKLCAELGEPGKNINDDIASLVKKGLPVEIQQALDIIRVVGNNAVHPGELQPDDVADVAFSLFELTNQIVEERVSKPKKLKALFARLPKGARDAIGKRDDTSQSPTTT